MMKHKVKEHTPLIVSIILILISMAGLTGCAKFSQPQDQKSLPADSPVLHDIQDLAGIWEYEDETGSYTITLNEEGKGPYDWEDGWFETQQLGDGMWKGIWRQAGNDREGKFKLELSDDAPVAKGYWWYTRIGEDRNPHKPGGEFTMRRMSSFLAGER